MELSLSPLLLMTHRLRDLTGAGLLMHLMDGTQLKGLLVGIDEAAGQVSVQELGGGKARDFPLAGVRCLVLPATPPGDRQAQPPDAADAGSAETLKVNFQDGRVIAFQTIHFQRDAHGLHFFHTGKDGRLVRVYVPLVATRSFQVEHAAQAEPERPREAPAVRNSVELREFLNRQASREYLNDPSWVPESLREALKQSPSMRDQKLGEALVKRHLISEQQLHDAQALLKRRPGKRLGDVLVDMGALNADYFHGVLAHKLGLPYARLRGFDFDARAAAVVSPDFARKHSVMPLAFHNDRLVIAVSDPESAEVVELLRFTTQRPLELAVATRQDIDQAVSHFYGSRDSARALEEMDLPASILRDDEAALREAERMANDKPLVKVVNNFILDAIHRRASDIHLRPGEDHVDLLYRIDGVLTPVITFPKALHAVLVSRIKILGGMDIAERRLPQDGQMRIMDGNNPVDLRISMMPTVDGESAVIRVLNAQAGLKPVKELGFSEKDLELIKDMLHRSHGMFLVTGPTGSGKSTTLYSALGEIMRQNVNIITVEDPVEYRIEGIEQIQVRSDIGYTFARALRHILRHDPDCIMIGEIRDQETAEIAVKSALTGHLVLSTLHTNDAVGAITRLRDMGAVPYLLSATLLGVQAQRLVRRNCTYCAEIEEVEPVVRQALGVREDEVFVKGRGCEACGGTGYSGRMAAYELVHTTPALQDLITAGAPGEELHAQAVKDGMVPLTQHALGLARARKTSLAEVYRVRIE